MTSDPGLPVHHVQKLLWVLMRGEQAYRRVVADVARPTAQQQPAGQWQTKPFHLALAQWESNFWDDGAARIRDPWAPRVGHRAFLSIAPVSWTRDTRKCRFHLELTLPQLVNGAQDPCVHRHNTLAVGRMGVDGTTAWENFGGCNATILPPSMRDLSCTPTGDPSRAVQIKVNLPRDGFIYRLLQSFLRQCIFKDVYLSRFRGQIANFVRHEPLHNATARSTISTDEPIVDSYNLLSLRVERGRGRGN